jgi:hypothetical protein
MTTVTTMMQSAAAYCLANAGQRLHLTAGQVAFAGMVPGELPTWAAQRGLECEPGTFRQMAGWWLWRGARSEKQ